MKEKQANTPWWPLILLVFAILASWYLWPQIVPKLTAISSSSPLSDRGLFGDSFGGLNALFSGLAFAALGYTMWMQRTELQETRAILKSQKGEAETQNATLARQTFENTFFQLLRLHSSNLSSIDLRTHRVTIGAGHLAESRGGEVYATGRECFRTFRNRLVEEWKGVGGFYCDPLAKIDDAYSRFFRAHESDLGHYFRGLYHLIKFVDQSDVLNKKFYVTLLRAQLSSHELAILYYNCLSSYGREKFLPYAIEYALFHNLNKSLMLDPDSHLNLIDKRAFGLA